MAEFPPDKPIEEEEEMKTEKPDHAETIGEEVRTEDVTENKETSEEIDGKPQEDSIHKESVDENYPMKKKCQEDLFLEEEIPTEEATDDFDPATSILKLNIDEKETSEEGYKNLQEQSTNKKTIDENDSMKNSQEEELFLDVEDIHMQREIAKSEDREIMRRDRGLDRNDAPNQNYGAPSWRGPQNTSQRPPMANQMRSMPPNQMNILGPYRMQQPYHNAGGPPMMYPPNQNYGAPYWRGPQNTSQQYPPMANQTNVPSPPMMYPPPEFYQQNQIRAPMIYQTPNPMMYYHPPQQLNQMGMAPRFFPNQAPMRSMMHQPRRFTSPGTNLMNNQQQNYMRPPQTMQQNQMMYNQQQQQRFRNMEPSGRPRSFVEDQNYHNQQRWQSRRYNGGTSSHQVQYPQQRPR